MKKKKFTKIRENITEVEYQKLLTYLNGKEDLTTNTKNNLRRTFILLYFTGMRVNEVKQLKVKDINTIFEKEELIIVTHKTRKERKLFFSTAIFTLLSSNILSFSPISLSNFNSYDKPEQPPLFTPTRT